MTVTCKVASSLPEQAPITPKGFKVEHKIKTGQPTTNNAFGQRQQKT
jgi:hypothetical protein